MDRIIFAQNEYLDQVPFLPDPSKERKIAERLAKRHKVGARFNDFDEIEFFHLKDDQEPGFYDV